MEIHLEIQKKQEGSQESYIIFSVGENNSFTLLSKEIETCWAKFMKFRDSYNA